MYSSWPPQDRQEIIEAVRADVISKLGVFFDPTGELGRFSFEGETPEEIVMSSTSAVSVGWSFSGIHTGRFVGIEPTGLPVKVVGLTMLHGTEENPMVRRYIDWHDVLAQLGSLPGRAAPMVCSTPRQNGDHTRQSGDHSKPEAPVEFTRRNWRSNYDASV